MVHAELERQDREGCHSCIRDHYLLFFSFMQHFLSSSCVFMLMQTFIECKFINISMLSLVTWVRKIILPFSMMELPCFLSRMQEQSVNVVNSFPSTYYLLSYTWLLLSHIIFGTINMSIAVSTGVGKNLLTETK
jgi:hypothetical protein